jgi:ParB/RepB/Spo0J family partition protein
MASGIKEIAKGRSDQYRLSPYDLNTKDGWNVREQDFNEDDPEDIALAQSIAEVGVKQALAVYWEDGKAYVSDGHRRRAAALVAIEKFGADKDMTVPVVAENRNADEAERVFSMIVRNSGKPLSPLEQGMVFRRLMGLGWSDSIIAKKAGISRVHVSNLIALSDAPKALTNMVREGAVSATLAITTLNKHKGDAKAASTELKEAVKEAKKAGKTRATAKHVRKAAEKKTPKEKAAPRVDLKAELKSLLTAHPLTSPDGLTIPDRDDIYLIPVTVEQWGRIRELLDIEFIKEAGVPARAADDLV